MTAFNISGIVSGIDTTSLISQLMAAAAAPQTALKNEVTTDNNQISAYQAINTDLAAVESAAQALSDPDTWNATTATSSSSSVVATGSTSAQAGSYTSFDVLKVATAQVTTVAATGSSIADPANGIVVVGADGTSHHIDLADGSAAGVAAAVNAAGLGLRAAVITTDSGPVVQFTSTSTGAASAFTIQGLNSPTNNLVDAQDAQIKVGGSAAGSYTISSSTNTFTDAIPGVTFTVSQPATGVTISVASDESSVSDKVKALVDSINTALTDLGSATAKGALLSGDNTLETLQQQLLGVVSAGTSTGGSFATYGIDITSTGQLTFDADKFSAAYAADPSGTQAAVTEFSNSTNSVGTSATDTGTGSITTLINNETSQVTSLNSQISDWDTRLADQQTALETKYAAMETALSTLKNESNFLTSQFNALSANSSGSSS